MRIYVASSWRNNYQPGVVEFLRRMEHNVYDFRNPAEGSHGFHWSEIDSDAGEDKYTALGLNVLLNHPISRAGFHRDMKALQECDACVLVLPSGRSAHLEFGWAVGANKKTIVYIPEDCPQGPDLMYKMAGSIVGSLQDIQTSLHDGHSMGRFLPCMACGDIDGCHRWRDGGNQFDSRKYVPPASL